MWRNTLQFPSHTASQRFSESEAYNRSGLSHPERHWYSFALSPGSTNWNGSTSHHFPPLFMCPCLCLSLLLRESTSSEGSSHIKAGCRVLSILHKRWLTLGIWRRSVILLENWRSHSRKATSCSTQGVPPCDTSCRRCSWMPPAEGQLEAPLTHTAPLGCRVWFSVPTVIWEIALLKRAEEVLNTYRTLKKKTCLQFHWIYHTYRFTLEKSCITIYFT